MTLYAVALHDYGLFHLMDYPIFLGLAAYLALTGLGLEPFGLRFPTWTAGPPPSR